MKDSMTGKKYVSKIGDKIVNFCKKNNIFKNQIL